MSQLVRLTLSPVAQVQLSREASNAYPLETCGALLGSADHVTRLHPLANRAADPRSGFVIDPVELEPLLRGEADGGLPVLGFYHSHPDNTCLPSRRDLEGAWPGYWNVIIGVDQGVAGLPHAWQAEPAAGVDA